MYLPMVWFWKDILVLYISNYLVGCQVQKFWIGDDQSRDAVFRVGERRVHAMCFL